MGGTCVVFLCGLSDEGENQRDGVRQARGILAEELCQGLTSHLPQRWEIASYIGRGLRQAVRGLNRCRETTWETVIQGTSQSG